MPLILKRKLETSARRCRRCRRRRRVRISFLVLLLLAYRPLAGVGATRQAKHSSSKQRGAAAASG